MVTPLPTGRERLAAVVLLLYMRDGQPTTILTRRTELVSGHKGEISLPGGRLDPDDASLWAAAARECWEEIGVTADRLRLLGALAPVLTVVSNYAITPFVAVLDRPEFAVNPHEIAELIELPLGELLRPGVLREEIWEHDDVPRSVYFYTVGQHVIWGATARILHQFLRSPYWQPG